MNKLIIIPIMLFSASVIAEDFYTCDGFKYNKEENIRTPITDAKFEIEERAYGISITNNKTGDVFVAANKIGDRHFKNGNFEILAQNRKKGGIIFGYMNEATKQTVMFANCIPKPDF
ncbi:hypothetical protein [Serratia sp. 14-2641]|uniref:hypothetical protein n=1 Tax=Serratia sp. 14-2641 TaxID=1841657 RepID=UPI00080FDDDC|nr:hypothetical protein [Serratia sp. 14-2641]OCJ20029.1 hypothetical protein A6U95_15315 [Serratia sp. 14-2641]